jgi:hypothetical protein
LEQILRRSPLFERSQKSKSEGENQQRENYQSGASEKSGFAPGMGSDWRRRTRRFPIGGPVGAFSDNAFASGKARSRCLRIQQGRGEQRERGEKYSRGLTHSAARQDSCPMNQHSMSVSA